LGQNRGGTPIDVRIPKDARPCPAARHEDNLRLSAFRFLLFLLGEASVADSEKAGTTPSFSVGHLLFALQSWRQLRNSGARERERSSAPAIAGEGDHAKHGGGGV
jgi:hypothetical protein